MNDEGARPRRGASAGARVPEVRAVYLRLLALELVINIPLIAAWISNSLASAPALLGLHGARVAIVWLVLWVMLEPLRRWRAAAEPSDAMLLDADACLQRLFGRFMAVYIPAMALATAGALILRAAAQPIAPAELMFGGLFVFVAVGLNSAVIFARMRGVMDAYMAELGPALALRRLSPQRVERSSRRELVLISAVLAFTTLTAGGASGFNYDARRLQAETKLELRDQLGRAAEQLRTQASIDQPGVELVAAADLPPSLAPTGQSREFVAVYEPDADRVVAALALDDGRYLVRAATPPYDLLLGFINLMMFELLIIGLVSATFTWLTRALFDPLARLDDASTRMATHGDLRALARAYPARDDEVGSLVRNFNDMLDMLDELVRGANAVAKGELRTELHHPGELHDAFRTMVEQLRDMVFSLRSVSLEVTSASSEIHARMQAQAGAATEHADAVEASSETIVALADAARQISDKSTMVRDQAEASLDTIDAVSAKIAGLDEQTAGVAELLDRIREIAARSDLLALNGSLEATRAGEAGRGFALVAAEMRRLAEAITAVVSEAELRVGAIVSASAQTVAATERSRSLADSSAELAREISALTQAQREGSEEASASAQATAAFVRGSAMSVRQTSDAAEGLRALVAELERLTQQFDLS